MQTILLTGADGGIGAATGELLTHAGLRVLTTTRADTDMTSAEDIQKLMGRILTDTPHIDWIVCAHGFIDTETVLEKQAPENIQTTFAVNALSIIYLARQFLPIISKGGGIIALSSSAGLNANGRFSAYSASKAAVNSFMQAMALNRPEQKFFAVCPGPTNTAMRERVAHDAAQMQDPRVIAEVILAIITGDPQYKSGDLVLIKNAVTSVVGRV